MKLSTPPYEEILVPEPHVNLSAHVALPLVDCIVIIVYSNYLKFSFSKNVSFNQLIFGYFVFLSLGLFPFVFLSLGLFPFIFFSLGVFPFDLD